MLHQPSDPPRWPDVTSQEASGSPGPSRFPASVAHTHLFRGAIVHIRGAEAQAPGTGTIRPIGLRLVFADGVPADAEVLMQSQGGGTILEVQGHRTAAGTEIPSHSWEVREIATVPAGLSLKIGRRLA